MAIDRNAPSRTLRQGATPDVHIPAAQQARTTVQVSPQEEPEIIIDDGLGGDAHAGGDAVRDDELNGLRQQVQTANESAAADRRARDEADRRLHQTQAQTLDSQRSAIENGLTGAQAEVERAEQQYAAAVAEAKPDLIAKANTAVNAALIKRSNFEGQKANFETQVQQRGGAVRAAPTATPTQQPNAADAYTDLEKAWIRDNPAFDTDQKFRAKASAAAQLAILEGHDRNSPEYRNFIDKQLGLKKETTVAPPSNQNQQQRQPVSTAAPVSRTSSPRQSSSNTLTLSRAPVEGTNGLSEVEAAELSYPDKPKAEAYRLYVADREQLRAEGKIGRA